MSPDQRARIMFLVTGPVPDDTPIGQHWTPPPGGIGPATYGDLRAAMSALARFEDQCRGLLKQMEAAGAPGAQSEG